MTFNIVVNGGGSDSGLAIWLPAIVSVFTLIVNVFFYIFVQPKIANTINARNDLKKIVISFMGYLTEVVSFSNFSGVPTEIRRYSLQIHLCFKSGVAPSPIDVQLENIFQKAKERKEIREEEQELINQWNNDFRKQVHELRIELAKYCGTLNDKKLKTNHR